MVWFKISEKPPPEDIGVLISDGSHWSAARATYYTFGIKKGEFEFWQGQDFGGYEWEWDFEPVYWAHGPELPEGDRQ